MKQPSGLWASTETDLFSQNMFAANLSSAASAPLADRGGARRSRTDDLLLAKQALSQLSYGPFFPGASDAHLASAP